jgi:hypothetical protein
MTEQKKGWGQTVLGWFVVREGEEQGSLEDSLPPLPGSIVAAADARRHGAPLPLPPPPPAKGPAPAIPTAKASPLKAAPLPPPAPPLPVFQKEPPPAAGGEVNFAKVFEAATISAEEQERVAKSLALLKSLPSDTDPLVKKQIVEASLKAFGVPIDNIIETGVAEIQALEGYIRAVAARTQKGVEDSQKKIDDLEKSIKDLQAGMQKSVGEQQAVLKACNDKKLEVQHILEFFGQEAVAKVVQESPKLHSPDSLPH